MSDGFSFPGCFACGYYNPRRQSCGLIPEHRDILCPFHYSQEDLEGGDSDAGD